MTVTEPAPTADTSTGDDADLLHISCCLNDDLALCGLDVTGVDHADDLIEPVCVVCVDLVDTDHCPSGRKCVDGP